MFLYFKTAFYPKYIAIPYLVKMCLLTQMQFSTRIKLSIL